MSDLTWKAPFLIPQGPMKNPLACSTRLNEIGRIAVPVVAILCLYGVTNHSVTFFDDEVQTINGAKSSISSIVTALLSGAGRSEHPPLYDILLSAWMRVGGDSPWLLRLPSIILYIAGLALIGATLRFTPGVPSPHLRRGLWLGLVWPYGYFMGRAASWYSLSFFLVSAATFLYCRFVERPTFSRAFPLAVVGTLLNYCNFFGLLICATLGMDYWMHRDRSWRGLLRVFGMGVVFLVASVPLWRELLLHLTKPAAISRSLLENLILIIYGAYSSFFGESIAPWFYSLCIPSVLTFFCFIYLLLRSPKLGMEQRLFVYFISLLAVMGFYGILTTKRVMILCPWLLIPLIATLARQRSEKRQFFPTLLCLSFAASWYGIQKRDLASTVRFVEPWSHVATYADELAKKGNTVLSNHPSFFFYFDHLAGSEGQDLAAKVGQLSDPNFREPSGRVHLLVGNFTNLRHSPIQWEKSHPRCRKLSEKELFKDEGADLKQKLFSRDRQPTSRIIDAVFACPENS